MDPGRTAIGTWSGGRFMHFGEPISDERLLALFRPGDGIDTVITADVYGAGEADSLLGRALDGLARDSYSLVGAVGHDFVDGERDGPRGFPRFTDPRLRGPDGYADYLRRATEASLERVGADSFDLLLLHNPDRTGFTSEAVWDGMDAASRSRADGGDRSRSRAGERLHPRPARLLRALRRPDRLGDGDPQPARALARRALPRRRRRARDPGDHAGGRLRGSVLGRRRPRPRVRRVRPPALSAPRAGSRPGTDGSSCMRPLAEAAGLTPIQLACQWNLAHEAVECAAPTLIQEAGPEARPVEDKRAELAALPKQRLGLDRGRADPRDRRQHRLDDAQGRQPRARGRRAARPLAAQRRAGRGRAGAGASTPSATCAVWLAVG